MIYNMEDDVFSNTKLLEINLILFNFTEKCVN